MVIVGGGVAGCAAALSLPPGARGLLVERAAAGAERCCGGLLSPDAQRALARLGVSVPPVCLVRLEPRTVRVHDLDSGRGRTYRRDYLNVDRLLFDSWLLGLAAQRVEVRHGTRFVGLHPEGVLLKSSGGTETVSSRMVIGADGADSAVRKACLPGGAVPPLMLALQATLPSGSPAEHVVLFSSALTGFYAWAIPKGDATLIGCAFHDKRGARERFERVLDWYREELALEGNATGRSGRYLSQPRAWSHLSAGSGRVLLVGEAAGLVSPSSGEGISFGLTSGAAAGRAVGSVAQYGSGRGAELVPGRVAERAEDAAAEYRKAFLPLACKVMVKTVKARVIYSPAARDWALRLPWCP